MKIKLITIFTCLFMLFSLPSYGATKKKVVATKPPLEFNFLITDSNNPFDYYETQIIEDSIGMPNLQLVTINVSNKNIVAFEFTTSFIDAFGRPVYKLKTKDKTYKGIVQKTLITPGSKNGKVYKFNLVLYRLAQEVKRDKYENLEIKLTKVKFADGKILNFK